MAAAMRLSSAEPQGNPEGRPKIAQKKKGGEYPPVWS
jgi:hypothetical protein